MNTTKQNKTPDYLVYQVVQCANNYSEWDVRQMYFCLTDAEKQFVKDELKKMIGERTNDRIVRAIAIMQDIADLQEKIDNFRKIQITEINPKGKQKIRVRFIS